MKIVAQLGKSFFYRYYFASCSSELAQFIPLPYPQGRSARYSDRLHDIFLSPFLDVIRMSMPRVSFPAEQDSGISLWFLCSGIRHELVLDSFVGTSIGKKLVK